MQVSKCKVKQNNVALFSDKGQTDVTDSQESVSGLNTVHVCVFNP